MPGTGEYALATSAVHYPEGPGVNRTANMNFPSGHDRFLYFASCICGKNCRTFVRFRWSSRGLGATCAAETAWCGRRSSRSRADGAGMPWRAGGISRAAAAQIQQIEGRSVYGGTPADAVGHRGDPCHPDGGAGGDVLSVPADGTAGRKYAARPLERWHAGSQCCRGGGGSRHLARLGRWDAGPHGYRRRSRWRRSSVPRSASDFSRSGDLIAYSGPAEWRYRRFILHYAHLCAAAGGVDTFCIGSEMRGLTQMRGAGDSFPAVAAFRRLAADVRAILGPSVKSAMRRTGPNISAIKPKRGTHYFHLDPLWADPNIDFIGIDNYMPLSDWRDGEDHADAAWGSIYNLDYLMANIAGGEGFDWYYDSTDGAAVQRRLPIADGSYGEPWVFRYKDLKSWWSLAHHDRIEGFRQQSPTAWVPRSKPIRFTELGCPAVDKGTNQPNKFIDPKSSESKLPRFSTGRRDDLIQMQYLRAMSEFWERPENNPISPLYGGRMLDTSQCTCLGLGRAAIPGFSQSDLDMERWRELRARTLAERTGDRAGSWFGRRRYLRAGGSFLHRCVATSWSSAGLCNFRRRVCPIESTTADVGVWLRRGRA